MLVELAVRDLGVIADLRLTFGPGMTALTGETGAGKTMVVEALALLLGGRPDPARVRPGAPEAIVEGLFVVDGDEVVLRRVVPAVGRSRAQINGSLVPAATLAEVGLGLVEVCGQHGHQRLQTPRAQRDALDRFGDVELAQWTSARQRRDEIASRIEALGGDDRQRARELDLLRYQLDELDQAGLADALEDDRLATEEDLLDHAVEHAQSARLAANLLTDETGAADLVAKAISATQERRAFAEVTPRLRSILAELVDLGSDLRHIESTVDEDPARLDVVHRRRQALAELRRKYGESLGDVMAFHDELRQRVDELASHDEIARRLEQELAAADSDVAAAANEVRRQRLVAASPLATHTQTQLVDLGLAGASVAVAVGEDGAGDEVEFLFAASSGMAPQPLARAASGGELSRTMLAVALVLSDGSPTMVFDEVDAGIGGTAAVAVGRALARLGADRQVVVVTHLPQVAAAADVQLRVEKSTTGLAVSTITQLDHDERVIELSRMLSGSPDSESARAHAAELLADATTERRR